MSNDVVVYHGNCVDGICADDFLRFDHCYEGKKLEDAVTLLRTRERWTALDILDLEQYSARDRLWLVLRPELIPERTLHELACQFAEYALAKIENRGSRNIAAIEVKRLWIDGQATDEELSDARAAAWEVALVTARVARATAWIARVARGAGGTVSHAAWRAASFPADVASAQGWNAAWNDMLDMVRKVLCNHECAGGVCDVE